MIYWLVQSSTVHPQLIEGIPPSGLLNEDETQHFVSLHTPKRRFEWLLGRWTAKHLLRSVIESNYHVSPALDVLHILNRHTGEPYAAVEGQHVFSLSISHSHDYAFCAMVEKENWAIGADMEHIERRSSAFVEDYFTEPEIALLYGTPDDYLDTMITTMWSAKEAVLKALHLGLSVDTRSVTCLPTPVVESRHTWTPFTILIDTQRLHRTIPALSGWWRTMNDYVLTLVTQSLYINDLPVENPIQEFSL
jgi:4'-phosphopantetheinyl transferase